MGVDRFPSQQTSAVVFHKCLLLSTPRFGLCTGTSQGGRCSLRPFTGHLSVRKEASQHRAWALEPTGEMVRAGELPPPPGFLSKVKIILSYVSSAIKNAHKLTVYSVRLLVCTGSP